MRLTPIGLLAAFVAALLLSWLWRKLASQLSCFDIPNERSSHSQPVPRSGGLAFALVFLVGVWLGVPDNSLMAEWLPVYLPVLLVILSGVIDDFRGLGIAARLGLQSLSVALALSAIPALPTLPLPGLPDLQSAPVMLVLLFIAWLWFINLYNFMDGLDALAASEAIFAALAIALFAGIAGEWQLCMPALLLAVAVAGFLYFNLSPAQLFMGDAGSNFLGFLLMALGLTAVHLGLASLWTLLILFGVFIVDSTVTLLSRMHARELWYHGHRSHAYQRAADRLGSHGKVVMGVSLLNLCWLLPLAWLSTRLEHAGLMLTVVAWAPLLWLVVLCREPVVTANRKPTP